MAIDESQERTRSGAAPWHRLDWRLSASYVLLVALTVAVIGGVALAGATAVLVEDSPIDALDAWVRLRNRIVIASAALVGVAVLAGVAAAMRVGRPVSRLAAAAQRIGAGDRTARAPVGGSGELAGLARSLNAMVTEWSAMVDSLEQQVEERTRALSTAATVSRTASTELDPDALVQRVVTLIRDRFGLYYVGLFLVDEGGGWAVLHAGTGTFGEVMLAQGHRLQVGGESMIGQCVHGNQPLVALDVGEAAVRFDNPLLPETRSELALPVRSRGRVIGAMTIQSALPSAFDRAYIDVLQSMADQVGIAVDNARLFAEAQTSLRELEAAQQRYLAEAWSRYVSARHTWGYVLRGGRLSALDHHGSSESSLLGDGDRRSEPQPVAEDTTPAARDGVEGTGPPLVTPISLGGQPIGTLGLRGDATRQWSSADVELVRAITAQFAEAAENLRLLEQTERREATERMSRHVSAQIRAAVSVEDAVRRTLSALSQTLGVADLAARIGSEEVLRSALSSEGDGDG